MCDPEGLELKGSKWEFGAHFERFESRGVPQVVFLHPPFDQIHTKLSGVNRSRRIQTRNNLQTKNKKERKRDQRFRGFSERVQASTAKKVVESFFVENLPMLEPQCDPHDRV